MLPGPCSCQVHIRMLPVPCSRQVRLKIADAHCRTGPRSEMDWAHGFADPSVAGCCSLLQWVRKPIHLDVKSRTPRCTLEHWSEARETSEAS
jgi:hypothetical protein